MRRSLLGRFLYTASAFLISCFSQKPSEPALFSGTEQSVGTYSVDGNLLILATKVDTLTYCVRDQLHTLFTTIPRFVQID